MRPVASFFSESYAEAREKFLRAAEAAGAHLLDSHAHPLKGPDGGDLATDVAWIGPRSARKLLVLVSSTHGIEGYCGSGCQISWLENRHYHRDARPDTAALLIHAINPHGFAHGRSPAPMPPSPRITACATPTICPIPPAAANM
jgi:hypothetical protein